jgi:SPP1 gp7 family putative phage head morphogenesis protein
LTERKAALPEDFEAIGAIHEMFMKSCLMGMDAAVSGRKKREGDYADPLLLPDMPAKVLSFEGAVKFLNAQIPLGKKSYYALDGKLRLRAFTVGRLNDCDAVNKVKGILRAIHEQGGTAADFYKMTDAEILNGVGFGKGNMSYWETVYRTNTGTSQNAGRAMCFDEVPPIALELVGVQDSRQTDICRSLTESPFIRKYDDPIWKDLWPPFHFNCRTTVRGIYDPKELDEYGGPETAYRRGILRCRRKATGV